MYVRLDPSGGYQLRIGPMVRHYPSSETVARAMIRGRHSNVGKRVGVHGGKGPSAPMGTTAAQAKRTAEVKDLTPRQKKLYRQLRHQGATHDEALSRVKG